MRARDRHSRQPGIISANTRENLGISPLYRVLASWSNTVEIGVEKPLWASARSVAKKSARRGGKGTGLDNVYRPKETGGRNCAKTSFGCLYRRYERGV